MEKSEGGGNSGWLAEAGGWAPRKINQGKTFIQEVRAELKKVTWPGKDEVYATTLVVIGTTIFFGFFLWLLDIGFSQLAARILR